MSMSERPHILILMADQQRADCIGCAGHPQIKTPHLDRLAAEGMRFAQAATVSPICMPARASFINGLYPHNHGMWTNVGEMPADDETVFHHLQRAGYLTAHVGKSHYYVQERKTRHLAHREPYLHARGLEYAHETTGPWATCVTASYMTDDWQTKGLWEAFKQDYRKREHAPGGSNAATWPSPLPVEDFLDSYIGREAVEFVESYQDDRPMCLFVGFGGPHDPWDAPGEYAEMYAPQDAPPPIAIPQPNSTLPDWTAAKIDFNVSSQLALAKVPEIRANYYGKISLIDDWIGRILSAFERKGWLDDLLIVFWSDHGEMLGDHGRFQKQTFHESSVRVPLIVRWPGRIPENAVSPALAEIIDVFPTLLEAVGGEPSARCLGRSLWPVFRNGEAELRRHQLSEIDHCGRHIMIRSRRHKYAVDELRRGYLLYDLQNDPDEQHNLIADPKARGLQQQLHEDLLVRLAEAKCRV